MTALINNTTVAGALDGLTINNSNADLNNYLKQHDEGWFAYSIPAAENTRSMCCFNKGKQAVCDLSKNQHDYGSSNDNKLTENINIFVNLKQGQVRRILPVGDHCEVKSDGSTVDWLTAVDEQQSISWLKTSVTANIEERHNDSLYVLSLHQSTAAAEALYKLAKHNVNHYSEQAIFWLGQRQQDGFKHLESLYQSLPHGELRHSLNFALSENNNAASKQLLREIAQNDPDQEQQADAIFWLSQSDDTTDLPDFLIHLIDLSDSPTVKEKAIFSLSQIGTDEANGQLMKLVKDHTDAKVREKALFWLAQNDPESAQYSAIELLKSKRQESEQENAVFVLSQLPNDTAVTALFEIVKGDYNRSIKKKALFWLSQSDDEDTLKQLEEIL